MQIFASSKNWQVLINSFMIHLSYATIKNEKVVNEEMINSEQNDFGNLLSVLLLKNMAKVTIYTTPSCAYCDMAKEFLGKNQIQYEEKNVAQDDEARSESIEKSGQMGVPVIDINGEIVVGFNRERIMQLLGIS